MPGIVIHPTLYFNFAALALTIKDFIQRASRPVVLLHGIEFLVSRDAFASVQRVVQGLTEVNATKGGVLLLPLTPKALDEKDEAHLTAETSPLPHPSGMGRAE